VSSTYTTLCNACGRRQKNDFAQVDAIAEGRVWAGSEAVKRSCGQNWLDAIKEAAVLGKQKIYNTLSRIQQRC
jgi:protease-4